MIMLNNIKKLIENNPVAFSTVTEKNKPNVIGVAFVKVVSDNQILITDNYMNQTVSDISKNKDVCLVVWDSLMFGYKLIGEAEYYTEGVWKQYVEKMEENKDLPAKGAILIKVTKVIGSK